MVESFAIEFHFTDKDKVYDGDSFCDSVRKDFFSKLILAIWEVNNVCSDGAFPLYKISIDTKDDHDLPSVDMSMPEKIMQAYENKD